MIRIRRRTVREAPFSMAPLIDVVFLLLIYFLLSAHFITEEGIDVKLPQARAAEIDAAEPVVVYVLRDGRIRHRDREVGKERLFDRLREELAGKGDPSVIIRADRSVILNRVVTVMDVAKAAGAGSIRLATEPLR